MCLLAQEDAGALRLAFPLGGRWSMLPCCSLYEVQALCALHPGDCETAGAGDGALRRSPLKGARWSFQLSDEGVKIRKTYLHDVARW